MCCDGVRDYELQQGLVGVRIVGVLQATLSVRSSRPSYYSQRHIKPTWTCAQRCSKATLRETLLLGSDVEIGSSFTFILNQVASVGVCQLVTGRILAKRSRSLPFGCLPSRSTHSLHSQIAQSAITYVDCSVLSKLSKLMQPWTSHSIRLSHTGLIQRHSRLPAISFGRGGSRSGRPSLLAKLQDVSTFHRNSRYNTRDGQGITHCHGSAQKQS